MPNSFSRFLNTSELQDVRQAYLKSLDEAGDDDLTNAANTPAPEDVTDAPPATNDDLGS